MKRPRQFVLVALVAVVAALGGYGAYLLQSRSDAADAAGVMGMRLPDMNGRSQALAQWRGKVLVVNFWATWCAPCREEIPVFVKLQKKYGDRGLQLVGIAIDRRDSVREFAREFAIDYPLLIGGMESVDLSRQAGNRVGGLPYTVVIDRGGRVVARELGSVKEARFEAFVRSLL